MSTISKIAELESDLAFIKDCIKKAMAVQSYSTGSTSVSAGNLATLLAEKKEIEGRLARLKGGRGSICRVPKFEDTY